MVVLIIVVVGILNFFYLIPPVINWDEGTHAIWGFREWLALKDANLSAFWQFSRDQFAYPPLGSWLIAFVNFPFEFSMNLTRFVSTIGFIVGGILLFLIAHNLFSDKTGPASARHVPYGNMARIAGGVFFEKSEKNPRTTLALSPVLSLILNTKFLTLFLYLSSPAILFYSVTVFKESLGAALTLLVFYLYFRALSQKNARSFFCVGLSLILLFLEKYNYAILIVLTLGLEAVIELVFCCYGALKKTRPLGVKVGSFLGRQIGIFLPLLVFASWWILTPTNKLSWFMDIMRSDWNPVTVGVGNELEYLLFFVQSVRVSYSFSNVLFLLILIGFFRAIGDVGIKKIRVLLVFFTLNFVLGTMHWYNLQDRYIYTSIPVLFLLVGYGWSKILVKVTGPATLLSILSIFTLLILKDFFSLPSYLKANATHMLLSAMYNERDYHDTLFNFDFEKWPKLASSKKLMANSETSEGVIDYILDKVDINKPVEIIGYTSEISPDWIELRMAMRRRDKNYNRYNNYNRYIVTIEVKKTSRLYTYDYKRANAWQLGKIAEIERTYGEYLIEKKDFVELGVQVGIYGFD